MISTLIIFELVLGCGGGNDGNGDSTNISDITPLLGTWERTENNCTESLEFYNDKTFKINSHLEIQSGTYELTKKGNNEYILSIIIESDNGEISCPELGVGEEAEDDTGSQITVDISIIDDQLIFIIAPDISLSYQKILPITNNKILQEISITTFDYDIYQSQVAINNDGTKILVAFINEEDLYAIYYNHSTWGSPIKLSEDTAGHSEPYHKLIMNDHGVAVLFHYSESRIGTEGTFSLSYFDGNNWLYTKEIEGAFSYCHIDSSGIAYVITKKSVEVTDQDSFKISRFNNSGYIDDKDFQADILGTIHGMVISTNEDNKAMLMYTIYTDEHPHINLGRMILFDGNEWSDFYLWNPKYMSGGILKYHKDGTADFVECGPHLLSLAYHKFNGDQWICELEIDYQMGIDLSISLNDIGQFMAGYEKPSRERPYHIESFLYTEVGDTITSIIDNDDDWEAAPKMFNYQNKYFVAIWESYNRCMFSYYSETWNIPIILNRSITVYHGFSSFAMNKAGYIVISTGNDYFGIDKPSIMICKFLPD